MKILIDNIIFFCDAREPWQIISDAFVDKFKGQWTRPDAWSFSIVFPF